MSNVAPPVGFECLLCQGRSFDTVCRYHCVHRGSQVLFGGRSVFRCRQCELQQIDFAPGPVTLDEYYRQTYRATPERGFGVLPVNVERFPADNLFRLSRGRTQAEFADRILSLGSLNNPRVMEVGAGAGHNLWAFRERFGPDLFITACEPDPSCAPFLEKVRSNSLYQTFVDSDEAVSQIAVDGPYNAILLSHVLEHVREPHTFLRRLAPLLAPGGGIVIEVPHDSKEWIRREHNHAPHLSFFEPQTLEECIRLAGGSAIGTYTCGPTTPGPVRALYRNVSIKWCPWLIRAERRLRQLGSWRPGKSFRTDDAEILRDTESVPCSEFRNASANGHLYLRTVAVFD